MTKGARSRTTIVRMDGSSARCALAMLALMAALGLGGWALLAGGASGQTPRQAVPGAGDRASHEEPLAGADGADARLFRVEAIRAEPGSDGREVPIRISRPAALAAARGGTLDVELPDGTRYPVRYERSESAPGGTWTFIGRVDTAVGALAAVITFGRDGTFGLLPTPDGRMMEITSRAGQAFLRPAGGIVPAGVDPAKHPDVVPAPQREPATGAGAQGAAPLSPTGLAWRSAPATPAATLGQAAASDGPVTIDILATYTSNLVVLRGSKAAAEASFQNVVAVANQAHIDSGSRVRFDIAGFVEIDYPPEAENVEVLYAIHSGMLPDDTDLHALRDAAGADLVAVMRPYADGDPSCGIAFLPGDGLMAYDLDPANGYSVTAVEACSPLVLAHELGHNLGSMHDRETVTEQGGGALYYGALPFSFGYRQDGPPAFATVMAYDVGEQVWIGQFSHPGSTLCAGTACGIAGESDNVRSLNITVDTVARFRDPPGTLSILDARVLESDDATKSMAFVIRASSPAPEGGVTFDVVVGGGTATPGTDWQPSWYIPTGLAPGATQEWFHLEIPPDMLEEGDETIEVRLENVQGMAVHDAEAVGVVQDDDPRVSVRGRLTFPPGVARPPVDYMSVQAHTTGLGMADSIDDIGLQMPSFRYEARVPKGGSVELSAALPEPFFTFPVSKMEVLQAVSGVEIPVQVGVQLAGQLRAFDGEAPVDVPVILWNARGPGTGYYVNYNPEWWLGGDAYLRDWEMLVVSHAPMQLEVRDPPPPYVRQLVEIPPLLGHEAWDVELRDVPSLTITHATVEEGAAADGATPVALTAELSVPAPAGGVEFDIEAGGTADAQDFQLEATTYVIPEGETTVPIVLAILGDDDGEPNETLELAVSDIRGAAWSPGPGIVRVMTDEPREVGDGRCDGATEWPAVRMCR